MASGYKMEAGAVLNVVSCCSIMVTWLLPTRDLCFAWRCTENSMCGIRTTPRESWSRHYCIVGTNPRGRSTAWIKILREIDQCKWSGVRWLATTAHSELVSGKNSGQHRKKLMERWDVLPAGDQTIVHCHSGFHVRKIILMNSILSSEPKVIILLLVCWFQMLLL